MAAEERALQRAKEKQEEAMELVGKLRAQVREAKNAQGPVGFHRKAIAAGAGLTLAIAEAGRIGTLFGRPVTVADLLPLADFGVEKLTDGKPPGGFAGDCVRVLAQAGDVQVAEVARNAARTGIGLARAYLTMNRPAAGPSPRSAGPAGHPSPEPATVVDESGQPVTS